MEWYVGEVAFSACAYLEQGAAAGKCHGLYHAAAVDVFLATSCI